MRRPPTNASLLKISAITGVAAIVGISYCQWSLQNRLRESPYCKLAIEALSEHRVPNSNMQTLSVIKRCLKIPSVSIDCAVGATKLLGEAITSVGYDLGDSEHNYCNGSEAAYQVKVKGSKDQGKMFLWAKRQQNNQDWLLDRLELEVHSQPNRRYIIKKPQEQISTDK